MRRKGLYEAVFDVVMMSRRVDQRGGFGDLYERADELLDLAIHQITKETRFIHESGGVPAPLIVTDRDGARLVVHFDLVHIDVNGLQTVLGDDVRANYRMNGDLGSIVVGGHEYRWQEMVEGLRGALTAVENESIEAVLVCAEVLET